MWVSRHSLDRNGEGFVAVFDGGPITSDPGALLSLDRAPAA